MFKTPMVLVCFCSLAPHALTPVAGGHVVASWSAPNIFLTEADFVPQVGGAEDAGALLAVLYNATSSESSLAVFDAATLELRSQTPLGGVIPFHAHGIVCPKGMSCISNP
jgi:carotenoid cleavage dioxygenase-like enzyme